MWVSDSFIIMDTKLFKPMLDCQQQKQLSKEKEKQHGRRERKQRGHTKRIKEKQPNELTAKGKQNF